MYAPTTYLLTTLTTLTLLAAQANAFWLQDCADGVSHNFGEGAGCTSDSRFITESIKYNSVTVGCTLYAWSGEGCTGASWSSTEQNTCLEGPWPAYSWSCGAPYI
jgi:hypothetical protein